MVLSGHKNAEYWVRALFLSVHLPLRLEGNIYYGLEVVETERGPGVILEGLGEGRGEERALLAVILPDRGFDVAASQRRCRSFG